MRNYFSTLSRRSFLSSVAASIAGVGCSGWMPGLAHALQATGLRKKHCVLLWMTGGPTQTDTFDMKPEHANGGEFNPIETSAPGLYISEHLPMLAQHGHHLAIMRGMSTGEGDHGRGTFLMRTGRQPEGPLRFPTLGSMISKEIGDDSSTLPAFVSIASNPDFNPDAYDSGFMGPQYASLNVREQGFSEEGYVLLGVDDLEPTVGTSPSRSNSRLELLDSIQSQLVTRHPSAGAVLTHHTALNRAIRLMNSEEGKVFDLSEEPAEVRLAYGNSRFGQSCLLARRLIERGVGFVEVNLGEFGRWDTHNDNFTQVQQLSTELDAGWATLMTELEDRGLLEDTTLLWMGEFGRTPQINGSAGRDHYPNAWSAVLAGGGIAGGQAYGRTSEDGTEVVDGMVTTVDLLATLCGALGVDHKTQNMSDVGRPFRISDGTPIEAVLA
jgi:hypothetical protein